MRLSRVARLAPPVLAALLATACASLADRIVEPAGPASDHAGQRAFEHAAGIERRAFVTPDGLRIAYRFVPAAARGFDYRFERTDSGARFSLETGHDPTPLPVRGTVVLLHGWSMDASTMLPWALALSEHGLQAIAVDLRNHGHSGHAPTGYGLREARDVVALLDALRAQGDLHAPVYLSACPTAPPRRCSPKRARARSSMRSLPWSRMRTPLTRSPRWSKGPPRPGTGACAPCSHARSAGDTTTTPSPLRSTRPARAWAWTWTRWT